MSGTSDMARFRALMRHTSLMARRVAVNSRVELARVDLTDESLGTIQRYIEVCFTSSGYRSWK